MKHPGFFDIKTADFISGFACTSLKIACISVMTSSFNEFTFESVESRCITATPSSTVSVACFWAIAEEEDRYCLAMAAIK